METPFPLALTFDDVLLVPQRSGVTSRGDVSTAAPLTPSITLTNPIVSANMDTVTEWRMAIAMAQAGGLGVIHRFLSVEEQSDQVRRVKRRESHVIEQPYTIGPQFPIELAIELMHEHGINGLPVIDDDSRLVGLLTRRDVVAAASEGLVADAMTPRDRLETAEPTVSLTTARQQMAVRRVEKLPLVDGDDRLVGLITMKDIDHLSLFPNATKDARGRLRVGAAIGVRGDYLERARACADAGADVLCLDIAHGHAEHAIAATQELRRTVDVEIIAGNVATPAGARDLIAAGAHAIKVGVGPGSVCTTRLVAGVGVPQLTAVLECARACRDAGIPVCADGGIRMPADVSKAIAAGAHTVMVGNLLAGTTESPGSLLERNGRMLKVHRGMASQGGMDRRRASEADSGGAGEFGQVVPEGVEAVVPHRGDASSVVRELMGGLRSAMSYSNAHTIGEFHENASFVRITTAGQIESRPHDVEV